MNNRRKFIISSLSGLAIAVLPKLTYASSNPDVVVIGAGAAGLAATSELIKNGKKVICLEASNRIGGRAYTDNEIFGEPYDLGALWLENGDTNPFKIYAFVFVINLRVFNLIVKAGVFNILDVY